jgi:hypothetical protein
VGQPFRVVAGVACHHVATSANFVDHFYFGVQGPIAPTAVRGGTARLDNKAVGRGAALVWDQVWVTDKAAALCAVALRPPSHWSPNIQHPQGPLPQQSKHALIYSCSTHAATITMPL